MKKILILFLTIFLFVNQSGYAQDVPEGAIVIDENTIIKDIDGNTLEISEFMELMNTNEWFMEPVNDEDGNLLHLQLRKATTEEKKIMTSMPMDGGGSERIGQKAPDFEMVDANGKTISSQNTIGKVVVLNFWFAACKPCIAEIPELNEVYEKYKDSLNVVFASVTFEEEKEVQKFIKKYPIQYPLVSNADETCKLFNIVGFPTNIVIDKNGKYHDFISGGFPQIGDQILNSIQSALDDKAPVNFTSHGEEMMIDPEATFMLEDGKEISFEKAIELLNSNKYDLIQTQVKDGDDFYLLKKI
jgi:peroxiredoxin